MNKKKGICNGEFGYEEEKKKGKTAGDSVHTHTEKQGIHLAFT
jgi:hypothetical protein